MFGHPLSAHPWPGAHTSAPSLAPPVRIHEEFENMEGAYERERQVVLTCPRFMYQSL